MEVLSDERGASRQARLWGGLAALLLVAATMALHIGLPLWDHIDLVPIYRAWQEGDVSSSAFWRVHDGSHLHTSAYAVLLLTTWLSQGRPWLDCLVSALLMAGVAVLLLRLANRILPRGLGRGWWFVLGLLAFYPGHLINLQWGWQVAVFISLVGMVVPVVLLTARSLRWSGWAASLLAAVLGVMSFGTTLAVFPVAVALLLLRSDWSWLRRGIGVSFWLMALAGLVAWMRWDRAGEAITRPQLGDVLLYAGNYLGSGLLHFAQSLALPWLVVALVVAAVVARRAPRQRLVPCLALMACATGAALLTAWGRAAPFGVEHGFMTRYVSYSILFWFGWLMLVLPAMTEQPAWRRWLRPVLLLVAVMATFNALHMTKKAIGVARNANAYAQQIVSQYPNYDPQLLERAYGPGRDQTAPELLDIWRQYGFGPFERRRSE